MSVLSEVFRISMGTPTIYKIVEFFQNYRTSKQISTDEENPTTIDQFEGRACNGYRTTPHSWITITGTYYAYASLWFNGHMYSNIRLEYVEGIGDCLYYDFDGTKINVGLAGDPPRTQADIKGFGLWDNYNGTVDPAIIRDTVNGLEITWIGGSVQCSGGEVSQSTEAAIDLDTWNTNIDWLDELIESGDDTYISIDSDSYEEVSDPEELADTIMDAITDNDYEGTIAESPEPISYATTVKAALDDIYTQFNTTMRWTSAPATASSTGIKGQMAKDSSYLYICVATNTWKRFSLEAILSSFSINGVSYQADTTSTWAEWIISSYNTDSYAISGTCIEDTNKNGVSLNSSLVQKTSTIVNNTAYAIVSSISFTIDGTAFYSYSGLSFAQTIAYGKMSGYGCLNGHVYYSNGKTLQLNGVNVSSTDLIVSGSTYTLSEEASFDLFVEDCKPTDFVRVSSCSGDKATCGGRYFMRDTDETILITKFYSGSYSGYAFVSALSTLSGTYSSYGSITEAQSYTTISGNTVYVYRMASAWGGRYSIQLLINSIEDSFTSTYDAYYNSSQNEFLGDNADTLKLCVDIYSNLVNS